jgi:hypothetical protein
MDVAPGRAELSFAPVPAEIVPGSATLVSLTDATAVRVLGPARHDPGKRQLTWDIETSIPGTAHTPAPGEWDGRQRGRSPRSADSPYTIDREPIPGSKHHASAGTPHLMEAAYTTDAIAWRASYELVLDASRRRGRLRAALTIDNRTDLDVQAATVRVTGAPQAGLQNQIDGQTGPLPAWFVLDQPVTIPAGRATRYPMLDQGREVAVAVRLFHDSVGVELDYRSLKPVAAESYGAGAPARRGDSTVFRRLEIDRDRAPWLAALPAGELLGQTFAPGDDASVVLGPAPEWHARRWQSDFLHDPHGRRVVEEIRVKIDSRATEPAVVVVREHLYRGLNWTIAYHNEVAAARKEGPQAVRFEVPVPARGSALLVYRVVYTW